MYCSASAGTNWRRSAVCNVAKQLGAFDSETRESCCNGKAVIKPTFIAFLSSMPASSLMFPGASAAEPAPAKTDAAHAANVGTARHWLSSVRAALCRWCCGSAHARSTRITCSESEGLGAYCIGGSGFERRWQMLFSCTGAYLFQVVNERPCLHTYQVAVPDHLGYETTDSSDRTPSSAGHELERALQSCRG